MFVQKFNQVTEQLCRELPNHKPAGFYLFHATRIWCNLLDISPDERNYILEGYKQLDVIKELTNYLYEESKEEEGKNLLEHTKRAFTKSRIDYFIAGIFNRMNIKSENIKIIVLIAFGITAVGYWLYKINRQRHQQTFGREEPRQYNPNPPSPIVQSPPIQRITKQFLVLVVSASQADFLESLKSKGRINVNDGEELYEMTKYLWLGSETDFNQKRANINQYSISKGQESEYDIYLIYIELNQADEGLKSNVNQLDRYDAFRNLDNLAVSFSISPRLQMEAYGKFDVYSR
jgi:hypothetical protein